MKKRFIGFGAGLLLIAAVISGSHSHQPTANLNTTPASAQTQTVQTTAAPAPQSTVTPAPSQPTTTTSTATPTSDSTSSAPSSDNLSNDNTYVNSDGNTVHSPAASTDGSVPAGATAQCADGTYSFSQHHSGTCSHHGGVAEWL